MCNRHGDNNPRSALYENRRSRERRCFVSRKCHPTCDLVRFVIGPDKSIIPDLAERLPGRGFWLLASREVVNTACSKKLFSKATGCAVTVMDNLADNIESQLSQRCLDWLGMARRSGDAVAGYEKVKSFIRGNVDPIILCASDVADGSQSKLIAKTREASVINIFSSSELGKIFGRQKTMFAAVRQRSLASRMMIETRRLEGFRNAGTA